MHESALLYLNIKCDWWAATCSWRPRLSGRNSSRSKSTCHFSRQSLHPNPLHLAEAPAIMSGLEPLAVFGLVTGTMQVVTFARDSISICKKIHDNGSPDHSLVQAAAQLRSASDALQRHLVTRPQALTADETALVKMATDCFNASLKLSDEIAKISSTPPAGRAKHLRVFGRASKRTWSKPKIDGLKEEMNGFQSVLSTGLLVRLW